jgi:hypothetical protein
MIGGARAASGSSELPVPDDWIHWPPPGESWLESFWFGFYDPALAVAMVALIGFNARGERSRLWLLLVEDGTVSVDATDLNLPLAAPRGHSVNVGGLCVELVCQSERYRLFYEADNVRFDLSWHARTPVKLTTGGRPFPGQLDKQPRGHSEQAGTVDGELRIAQRSYHIAGAPAWRDHLWGHAVSDGWSEMGEWTWFTGTTESGDLSFNISSHRFPDGRRGLYGFVFRDGAFRKVVVSRCDVETGDSGRRPQSCSVAWQESDSGIEYEMTGEALAPLWVVEPLAAGVCLVNDPPARFRINGEVAYGTMELGKILPTLD